MSAEQQTELLADFIMEEYPREITDGGVGDVAIKIMEKSVILNYTDTSILIEALRKHVKSDGSLGTYADGLLARLNEHKVAMYRVEDVDLPPISSN